MAEQLTFYVRVDEDPKQFAQRLAAEVGALADVASADAEAEEPERGAVEVLNEVTLTVTAAGGALTATASLVAQVQELLSRLKVRSAEVETSDGQVSQLVGDPMKENPAQ